MAPSIAGVEMVALEENVLEHSLTSYDMMSPFIMSNSSSKVGDSVLFEMILSTSTERFGCSFIWTRDESKSSEVNPSFFEFCTLLTNVIKEDQFSLYVKLGATFGLTFGYS